MNKNPIDEADRLAKAGEYDEALRLINKCLNDDPQSPRALFIAGFIMMRAERWGLAYNIFKRCIDLAPAIDACYNNAGMAAASCKDMLEEAEKLLRKALKMKPGNTAAMNNLALLGVHKGDPDMAIRFAEQSLAIDKEQAECQESLGYGYLMKGEWAKGWDGYEYSVGNSKYRKDMAFNGEPRWKFETGGKLVVRGEQGIGDEISFASIIPDAAKDNEITFECDARLEGLFKRSFPGIEIHGTRFLKEVEWPYDRKWDWHCLLGSLATKYRRTAESFPGTGFLVADPERCVQWRALLDTLPGLKVGVAWTGGLQNTFAHRRSFALESLLPILKTPGVTWVSMQYRDPTEEIAAFEAKHGIKIHHWERAAQAQNYDETAALVHELDLVITTTTALAHLCGALGKEAWVMAPSKARWFYGMKGQTIPWYSSLKIYRQSEKWPVERIANDLKTRINEQSGAALNHTEDRRDHAGITGTLHCRPARSEIGQDRAHGPM